jgi:hypothetical protein
VVAVVPRVGVGAHFGCDMWGVLIGCEAEGSDGRSDVVLSSRFLLVV